MAFTQTRLVQTIAAMVFWISATAAATAQETGPTPTAPASSHGSVLLLGGGFDGMFGPFGGAELVFLRHSDHTLDGGPALGFSVGPRGYRLSAGASGLMATTSKWTASAVSVRAVALRTRSTPRKGGAHSTYVGGEFGMAFANIGWSVGYLGKVMGEGEGGGHFYWSASYTVPLKLRTP